MHLRHSEYILRIEKRHLTPYIFKLIKMAIVVVPAFLLVYFLGKAASTEVGLVLFAICAFVAGIALGAMSIDYLMDKLIITNKRVIWVNWQSIFKKFEHETELLDIQDIDSREHGFLSQFKIFDYGLLEIETAASKTCVIFEDCRDPEGLKVFILNQIEKVRGGLHEKNENKVEDGWSVN